MLDHCAFAQALQKLLLPFQTVRRNDKADGPTDGFFSRIAEQTLSAAIPGRDDALQRLADDGVIGRGNDGGKQRIALFSSFEARVRLRQLAVRLRKLYRAVAHTFFQAFIQSSNLSLRALEILYVSTGAEPAQYRSLRIANGERSRDMPTVCAV